MLPMVTLVSLWLRHRLLLIPMAVERRVVVVVVVEIAAEGVMRTLPICLLNGTEVVLLAPVRSSLTL